MHINEQNSASFHTPHHSFNPDLSMSYQPLPLEIDCQTNSGMGDLIIRKPKPNCKTENSEEKFRDDRLGNENEQMRFEYNM